MVDQETVREIEAHFGGVYDECTECRTAKLIYMIACDDSRWCRDCYRTWQNSTV